MPRSSSGAFHAVRSPCVAVKTPPSGGPTSSPNTSVTPRCCSPYASAMRTACAMFAMSLASALRDALARVVVERPLPHVVRLRIGLRAHRRGGALRFGAVLLPHQAELGLRRNALRD